MLPEPELLLELVWFSLQPQLPPRSPKARRQAMKMPHPNCLPHCRAGFVFKTTLLVNPGNCVQSVRIRAAAARGQRPRDGRSLSLYTRAQPGFLCPVGYHARSQLPDSHPSDKNPSPGTPRSSCRLEGGGFGIQQLRFRCSERRRPARRHPVTAVLGRRRFVIRFSLYRPAPLPGFLPDLSHLPRSFADRFFELQRILAAAERGCGSLLPVVAGLCRGVAGGGATGLRSWWSAGSRARRKILWERLRSFKKRADTARAAGKRVRGFGRGWARWNDGLKGSFSETFQTLRSLKKES